MSERPNNSSRATRWIAWVTFSTLIAFVLLITVMAFTAPHPAQSALPATAQDIHLYRSPNYGFTGDYFDLMKAKISQDEFASFAKRLKLSPLTAIPDRIRGRFETFRTSERPWWNPSELMDGAYYDAGASGSKIVLAKYEDGYVYFQESCGY